VKKKKEAAPWPSQFLRLAGFWVPDLGFRS
jgi:hypothetical protein